MVKIINKVVIIKKTKKTKQNNFTYWYLEKHEKAVRGVCPVLRRLDNAIHYLVHKSNKKKSRG